MHKKFVRIECEVSDSQKFIYKLSCTFENRMCNLWQESKLRRKLTFWVTRQPASAQRQFERKKTKEVETVDFRPVKNERSHPQTFTENNLMHRTVFSIKTESRQERSQSWKHFADYERVFRLTMFFQNFVPNKQISERKCDGDNEKTRRFLNCLYHGNGSFSKEKNRIH